MSSIHLKSVVRALRSDLSVTASVLILASSLTVACAPSNAQQPETGSAVAPRIAEPTVLEIQVPTAMRDTPLPTIVVLPSAYAAQPDRAFPVFYLLHGAGGNHRSWVDATDIESLADAHELIGVCPDGGRTSWYFDSPLDPSYQFESFVSQELVAHIDAHYRTRKQRTARAVGGLSMGGHGALFLAIRHTDVFGTAISMSGGVDIRPCSRQDKKGPLRTVENGPPLSRPQALIGGAGGR